MFKVRGDTWEQVQKAIKELTLSKNGDGSYAHDNTQIFKKQVERVLNPQFYDDNDGKHDMQDLLSGTSNSLTRTKSTKTFTRASVIK